MSKFEYVDLSDPFAAGVRYVAAADRRRPSRPGLDALIIGNPEATALVVEGTPGQLQAFAAELAKRVAVPAAGPEPCPPVPTIERGPDEAERCDECGQLIPGGFGVSRAHLESCTMYGEDEPGWTAAGQKD